MVEELFTLVALTSEACAVSVAVSDVGARAVADCAESVAHSTAFIVATDALVGVSMSCTTASVSSLDLVTSCARASVLAKGASMSSESADASMAALLFAGIASFDAVSAANA